jgi:hypothetical protein
MLASYHHLTIDQRCQLHILKNSGESTEPKTVLTKSRQLNTTTNEQEPSPDKNLKLSERYAYIKKNKYNLTYVCSAVGTGS